MPTFGVQPAREEIRARGWSITATAEELGEQRSHLNNALLGYCAPSERLRRSLPELLGRPITELFTTDSLATPYGRSRCRRGDFVRAGDGPRASATGPARRNRFRVRGDGS